MRSSFRSFLIAIGILALCATGAHAAPAASAKTTKGETARSAGEPIEYAALEHQVGAVIVVETVLNTARRGTLVKYTNPALTLQLGPEAGSIQLTVPHDSIRRIMLVDAPPSSAKQPEAGSAKKN